MLLRRESRTHFIACAFAFVALTASRYVGFRAAGPDAILLTPSTVGFIADFVTAVLVLTIFRVIYGIPLWFARPVVRRIGNFVLFTLILGMVFAFRTRHALGARIEQGGVRVFYSYPKASLLIPTAELLPPRWRETSVVSFVEIPDTAIDFIPAFKFDATGQERLRSLFDALSKTATPPA